ncbi:DUF2767 family protein [Serratia bockelmannii]|uniref:DUF2767 family protein n=1 Tax=Serratia bockelmannii TaxID=2703793 RepID=UPI003FA6E0E2
MKRDASELHNEMCRVVGETVFEIHEFGVEPKAAVIAGMLKIVLANKKVVRSEMQKKSYGDGD